MLHCAPLGELYFRPLKMLRISTGSRRNPKKTRPWSVADDGNDVFNPSLASHQSNLPNKKRGKLKELENHCIIASDNAQLDHRDNLGSQKADPVGFGYPQNFTQLCIATRSTYKDSWESPA